MGAVIRGRFQRLPITVPDFVRDHPFLQSMACEVISLPAAASLDRLRRDRPTISGTPVFLPTHLGVLGANPGLSFNSGGGSSTGYQQFTGRTGSSANGYTFAGIVVRNATNNSSVSYIFSFETSVNTSLVASLLFGNGTQFSMYFAGTLRGSSVTLTIGVPYFIIASTETKGANSAWYIKILNLETGAMTSNQSGSATASSAGATSWSFLGSAAFGYSFTGYGHFACLGSKYLDPTLADVWLRDPTQIFVPSQGRTGVFDGVGAPTGVVGPLLGAGRLVSGGVLLGGRLAA